MICLLVITFFLLTLGSFSTIIGLGFVVDAIFDEEGRRWLREDPNAKVAIVGGLVALFLGFLVIAFLQNKLGI